MSSKSRTYKETFQLIADILSFENPSDALKSKFESGTVNWEELVTLASNYLVLTTCYSCIKRKDLLPYIPEDLNLYLEELTKINRNRNASIENQISEISEILNTHNIDYVFLKGSAFLINGNYEDPGERLVSDIDILVAEKDLNKAYELLAQKNYKKTERGISSKFFDHKHLPRLQSDVHLAAVEVHKKLILKSFKGILDPKDILRTKIRKNNTFVPSSKYLQLHCVLNFQVNDNGFVFSKFSFKTIYDLLILKQLGHFNMELLASHRYLSHFFSIAKLYFKDFKNFKSYPFTDNIYRLKLKSSTFRSITDLIIRKIRFIKAILTTRIWTFLNNKDYRAALFKDYKRILRI